MATAELEEAGESTDGMAESTSKLREEIKALSGVDIMLDSNTFKSSYQILEELSEKWQDLSDISQAAIVELMAGKHQGNVFSSLMENFSTAQEVLETSANSAGSAMAEHEKWMQSLDAKLNTLKASWQSLSQSFLSSDFLKVCLDGVIALVDGINSLIDTFGTLPTLVTAFATGMSIFKNKGFFKVIKDEATGAAVGIENVFTNAFKNIKTIIANFKTENVTAFTFDDNFNASLTEDIASLQMYEIALRSGMTEQEAFNATMKNASPAAQQFAKTMEVNTASIQQFEEQQRMAQLSLQAQNKSFVNCSSLIKSYNNSIETCGLTQEQFVQSVQQSNPALAKYLSGLNGADASLGEYILSLVGAKVATFALKAATLVLNAALTMCISLIVSGIVSAIQKWINAEDELAEKVEEVVAKFEEQQTSLVKNKSSFESLVEKYSKLSKGVDGLGRNISLTADEYSEYQSVVDSIADKIPTLVAGYNDQNTAILNLADGVDTLTDSYNSLIVAENDELLGQGKDIFKDFKNKMEDATESNFKGNKYTIGSNSALANILNSEDLDSAIDEYAATGSTAMVQIVKALKDKGLEQDGGTWWKFWTDAESGKDFIKRAITQNRTIVESIVNNFESTLADGTSGVASLAQAYLSNAFLGDYSDMNDLAQTLVTKVISSWDSEIYNQFDNVDEMYAELNNVLDQFSSIEEEYVDKIENAFDLQAEFNSGDIDYGDYIDKLKEVKNIIENLDLTGDAKKQLLISLDLDENGVLEQYDAIMKRLTSGEENSLGLNEKSAKKFLDSLSAEEYSILVSIIPDLEVGTTIDEIQAMIDEQMALEFTFDIDVQTEGIEALNTALEESRSATGLTAESIEALKSRYEDLDSFNAAALFEKTANGIHLNSEELARLEELYANTNKLEIDKNLNKLITKYNDLTKKIKSCTDAQEKESLQLQADKYKDKIEELQILTSQYDGLTSAYNKWQNALNGAEEGDNYDTLYENLEGIKELYDKGLVGTDKFKTAVQLMSDKDLSTASIEELVSAYEKGYPKMQRYFTEGQQGCKNFLSDVSSLNSEWAHMNADGSWEINFNAEEVAKELGVSVDFVLQIAKKLKDYGFEINLDDSSVDSLQTKIEKTEAKLKELGQSPVDINVDIEASSSNLGKIESEIEKAKAKITEINNSSVSPEVKTAQLEDAQAKLEALIDKKQEASQPAFMSLNTSQVNASMVEALERIQDYQNALNELNKLNELKEAGITIDDSEITAAQEKVDECAKAIQGLDGNVKVAIGLKEDGSIDSIKKSFENGEVKLDVNTDLASSKIEQLAENVERIEDKDVTIDVTVKGLKDVENLVKQVDKLNNKIDLATTIEGDIDKLSEYVENAKALKELGGNISSYVTANVKGNVLDEFEYKIDNLKVFTDSAKDVEKIGIVQSEVTADVKGNVVEEFEYKIDNLKTFSDSAKNISKIGNAESTVKANIEGNVTDEFEYKIDNLKVFSESAKDIHKIGNVESNVKVTINSGKDGDVIDEFEYKLNNLEKFAEYVKDLQGLQDVDISVNTTVNTGEDGDVVDEFEYKLDNLDKFADHVKELQGLQSVNISVDATINTGKNGDVIDEFEYKLNNLKKFADHVKDLQGLNSVDISVNATVNTGNDGDAIDTFEYKLNNLETFAEGAKALQDIGNVSSEITAKVNTGETGDAVDTFEYKLNNLETFAEGAKALQGIGDVSTTVTAKINSGEDGDVVDTFEYKINNLEKFAQYAQDLQGVGDVDVTISAKVNTGEDGDVVDEFEYKLNNLDEFSTYAKELQGLQDVDISIKANISTGEDSVTEEFEYKLNNLDSFADYAKSLQGLESVDITVTANAKGNVVGEKTEGKIDNLEVFAKGAKKVQNIESKSVTITANAKGNVVGKKTERKLDNLEVFGNSAKALNGLSSKEVSITANAYGNVTGGKTEEELKNLKTFSDSAKTLDGVDSKNISITANADGSAIAGEDASSRLSSLTEFKSLISGMSNQTVTVSVKANVDSENINKAITLLQGVADSGVFKDYTATVQVGAKINTIDDTTVQNYKAPQKEGKVAYSVDSTAVDNWTAPTKDGIVNYSASVEALTDAQKHKTGTITYKAIVTGFPVVNGTANVNGSAFANGTSGKAFKQGDWGVKQTTTALTGELGQELVVYKNKFWTVGDNGAEFATIPRGAIVFNHKQTAELFANGKVTSDGGRGRAFAEGTAFAAGIMGNNLRKDFAYTTILDGGGGGSSSVANTSGSSVANTSGSSVANTSGSGKIYEEIINSSSSSSSSSSSDDKFEDVIDWIEIILDRVERSIDKFDQQANNIYKSWSSRNTALQSQISEIGDEISLQEQAYNRYIQEANSVGLDATYASMVRNGSISIEDFEGESDEALVEKIKLYQEYYEKALDCEQAIADLKETEASLYAQRFEHIQSEYDGILQGYEHTEAMLNEYINQAEAKGYIVSKKYYESLIANEKSNIAELKKEQSELIKARDEAVASGAITEGSEAWLNMCADIDSVTQAIEAGNTALIEYANSMRDIDWEIFDLIQERISDVTSEADFLIELMSNKKLFDDDGKLTSQGLATMGLHTQNYDTYMYQADEYANEVAKLDKQIASDPYDQELINRRNELLELQREAILNAEDEKNAICDMVEEGINLELDALDERIQKYKEALDSQKDLYDYQKKVKEQTKEIASLEKQQAAYAGDDSEEAKQKLQKISVDLESARQDLQETEYDKLIDDTSALLDTLYNDYELILNTRLDNIDYLLEQVIDSINSTTGADGIISSALGGDGALSVAINDNATSIKDTLTSEANKVGTTLSNAMNSIWSVGEGNAKSVLTMYGEDFRTKSTTINTTLNSIKASVNSMVSALNKEATSKTTANKTSTSAKKNPTTSSSSSKKTTTKKSTSSGDGVPKIGDRVKYVDGIYYYDSQGKKPLGSHNKGKYVYITNINKKSWATHPYHISTGSKLGSGDLGWLKLNQLSGYAVGKKDFLDDEYAWTQENGKQEFIVRPSDGAILTPIAKGDSVLDTNASGNIWDMANSPAEFIKDNLKLDASNIPNSQNINNTYTQHIDKVVFDMENVKNYDEMLSAMQKDKNFERLILSMSVDRIAGKSSLAKGKSIR